MADPICGAQYGGYICTLPPGHAPLGHLGVLALRWPVRTLIVFEDAKAGEAGR